MPFSNAGVLISRDGSVRRYEGHARRTGEMLGQVYRKRGEWEARCQLCNLLLWGETRYEAVQNLKNHRRYHDTVGNR